MFRPDDAEGKEKHIAEKAISAIQSEIKTIQAKIAAEEKSESKEFAEQVNGLHQLLIPAQQLIEANIFVKPSKIKEIKKFLKDNSKEKTDDSGTQYLGSLFMINIHNESSLNLARAVKKLLDELKEKNNGIIVGIITTISKTARARINILLEQLPKLETNISAYEKANPTQSQTHSAVTSSSASSSATAPSPKHKQTANTSNTATELEHIPGVSSIFLPAGSKGGWSSSPTSTAIATTTLKK